MLNFKTWLSELSDDDTLRIAATLARQEARQAGVFSPTLLRLLEEEDYAALARFDFCYAEDPPILDLIHARATCGFFEKLRCLPGMSDEAKESDAFQKFLASEVHCRETNEFFHGLATGTINLVPELHALFQRAKWKIAKILGDAPRFADIRPRLGPGATTTTQKKEANPAFKFLPGRLACSRTSVQYLPSIFACNPGLYQVGSHRVDGDDDVYSFDVAVSAGALQFVPKDAFIHRSIVVEPVLTAMYQLGIGDIMSDRLSSVGLACSNSTRDQQRNRDLARLGSVRGFLATIDLSSASDMIATGLVRYLLPPQWYSLLSSFRSPVVSYKSTEFDLEKFSSMGNGFTFPLETLIFYALTWSASSREGRPFVSAYGDDLICASDDYYRVVGLLTHSGFIVNDKKSFHQGFFRESCGADYFRGIDVRPFRQKNNFSPASLYVLHNRYIRNYADEEARTVRELIPPHLRLFGPDGYGDGHLVVRDFRTYRRPRRDRGWGVLSFDTFSRVPAKIPGIRAGDYVGILYSIYASENTPEREPISRNGQFVKVVPSSTEYKRTSVYMFA